MCTGSQVKPKKKTESNQVRDGELNKVRHGNYQESANACDGNNS